jgi:hypothetical protein
MLNISELFYSAPGTQCTRYERVCRNAGNPKFQEFGNKLKQH